MAEESLNSLPDEEEADAWNEATAHRSLPSDLDREVYGTALGQGERGLLSKNMFKKELDKQFVKGRWKSIRRRGLQQGEKVRGIDNARSSKTNMAAFLQDTTTTFPHDIAVQILK